MTIGSLFSGIGGLELGLEMCGLGPVIWQCDSDPYARAVLEAHWPGVKRYEDVRQVDERAERPDIICGGFPCQPVSVAGKRKAQKDTRWLWPHFAAVVAAVRPSVVFIENVPGLRGSGLRDVLADLAALGFDAEWGCLGAAHVGAPHRRRRMFVLAHSDCERGRDQPRRVRWEGRQSPADSNSDGARGAVADSAGNGRHQGFGQSKRQDETAGGGRHGVVVGVHAGGGTWAAEPAVGRVVHGLPGRSHRIRLLGNACVPAQAALAWRTLTARLATLSLATLPPQVGGDQSAQQVDGDTTGPQVKR